MASKSKDVRIEQRRILEKKLEMRLSKLTGEGMAAQKINTDPIVKNLKAQIRETNIRIAAIDKNTVKIESMRQDKAKKLLEKSAPKETGAAPEKEAKSKKKAAPAEKEAKKKKEPAAEGEAAKKPKKKKEEAPAE
ncbi:MAG: hypothetical protein EG826_13900 [Deltaproteobacteria bacterium]|nr:hypothetical protein [Deltaproteobacteria bacterium]